MYGPAGHARHRHNVPRARYGLAETRAGYENPIQRPPHATPNHRHSEMSAARRPSVDQTGSRQAAKNRERKKQRQEQ